MATPSQMVLDYLQQRYGSYDATKLNVRRKVWYDEVRYPVAGTTSLSFFSIPVGGTDPNSNLAKTYEQTNVPRSGQFDGTTFFLYRIGTYIHLLPKQRQTSTIIALTRWFSSTSTVQYALHDLSMQGVLSAQIGQKLYFQIDRPFLKCPPCFGPEIIQLGSAAASGVAINNWFTQSNDTRDGYIAAPPQLIEKEQTFQWTMAFPDAASPAIPQISSQNIAVNIGVQLDGFTIENVQ